MQITLAVVALLALAFAEAAKPTTKEPKSTTEEPKFCNGIECPHFKIVNKTDKYEVRSYPTPYKWASTVVAGRTLTLFFVSAVYSSPLYPAGQNAQLGRLLLKGRKLSNAVTNTERSNEGTSNE